MRDLNEHVFDQLASSLGQPVFRAVLESYCLTLPTHLKHLSAAAAAQDCDAMGREAHDLKGVWGMVGAERVVDLAVRLHAACELQDAEGAASLVPEIVEASTLASGAIAQRLNAFAIPTEGALSVMAVGTAA